MESETLEQNQKNEQKISRKPLIDTQAKEELNALLDLLPEAIRQQINKQERDIELLEVVMDLGRRPSARFVDGEVILRDQEITQDEIDFVVNNIGKFDDDNRAGIARTLHRISALRNRRGDIVGLTCRVGRAVYGTSDIISDIIEDGKSLLLLGRPGVGKTTMLREVARILAENKRVVVVDTSNEIGGDGDIPHRAVGRARRMQVPKPAFQHETMIEAVENHNPEVIVIDEIGREAEALASRTINERGVQLVGTAHGNTLDNLLLNPTLSDLVGGIESVTLSDDEARRRGTQKTVLERRAPPTFDIVVEILDRDRVIVHRDVTKAVDGMLYGKPEPVQLRHWDETDELVVELQEVTELPAALSGRRGGRQGVGGSRLVREVRGRPDGQREGTVQPRRKINGSTTAKPHHRPLNIVTIDEENGEPKKPLRIFSYGVDRSRIYRAAGHLGLNVVLVEDVKDADVLVTLKSYYRRRRRLISDAEIYRVPVYILRANSIHQIENFLAEAAGMEVSPPDPFDKALVEANEAIRRVQAGENSVNLRPAHRDIRRHQHDMAREAELISQSFGQEPSRYVRIYGPNA
ncbi:MAG: R3H domain-containing nucleic acid-binding protein [Ardenticatenaceae bacterium]|nr:R3H domain-containing nucleic acid-binding protein [Ardenticatenaceae bacterium]